MSLGHNNPKWFTELDKPGEDLHLVPMLTGDKQHQKRLSCWCKPERLEKDPRVVLHLPSMSHWERR